MSLPRFLRRLFANDGYGPKLRDDIIPYDLCIRVYKTIHPTVIKPGMVPVNGTLLTDAVMRYPEAWAYLQTAEGQALCVTEAEWQAASKAYWYTNADGTKIGWEGIGGVCKYVIDTANGTIRVPDLRGMYEEMAGFDALGVGDVHGDAVGQHVHSIQQPYHADPATRYLKQTSQVAPGNSPYSEGMSSRVFGDPKFWYATDIVDLFNRIQIFNPVTKPRAWGALPCVYLGVPK